MHPSSPTAAPRLYLLKLLDESPRHGYEVIRLLEERFQGLDAPSAGPSTPGWPSWRQEGLVTHSTEGGRKVYAYGRGPRRTRHRADELADLEVEIRESVAEARRRDPGRCARRGGRSAARDAGRCQRGALAVVAPRDAANRTPPWGTSPTHGRQGVVAYRQGGDAPRQAGVEGAGPARQGREPKGPARRHNRARRQAKEAQERARAQAQEELQRIGRRVQEQVQDHFARGDWPTGGARGADQLAKEFGDFGKGLRARRVRGRTSGGSGRGTRAGRLSGLSARPEYSHTKKKGGLPRRVHEPSWAHEEVATSVDPTRDLDRLLDRFRDDIRDAARDHGVTDDQLPRRPPPPVDGGGTHRRHTARAEGLSHGIGGRFRRCARRSLRHTSTGSGPARRPARGRRNRSPRHRR